MPREGVFVFGFCVLTVSQLTQLVSDPDTIVVHATNFTEWAIFDIPILSNWFVLVVTLSLTLIGFVQRKKARLNLGGAPIF